jgi:hypothetical protein
MASQLALREATMRTVWLELQYLLQYVRYNVDVILL